MIGEFEINQTCSIEYEQKRKTKTEKNPNKMLAYESFELLDFPPPLISYIIAP